MRPKARGLVQYGGPPGWLEESDPRQVWFCTWWTGRTACLFRTVPVALTGVAQLRANGSSSCCYMINEDNHPSWATSRKEGMTWYSSRPILLLPLLLPYCTSTHLLNKACHGTFFHLSLTYSPSSISPLPFFPHMCFSPLLLNSLISHRPIPSQCIPLMM